MTDCVSCRDDRAKLTLAPVERVTLPADVTAEGFRRPELPTYVCAHCDGETMVENALRTYHVRQGR